MLTLYDIYQNYLNELMGENVENQPVGLTPDQLLLLNSQFKNPQLQDIGGGESRDEDTNENTENAGIESLGGLLDAVRGGTNFGSIVGGIFGGPIGAVLGNQAYNAFTGGRGRVGPGTGNLGGMGPSAFGPGVGEIDANVGFGSFTDTGQVTADGNNMGGGNVGGKTGGATDGTSDQGFGSADDGFR